MPNRLRLQSRPLNDDAEGHGGNPFDVQRSMCFVEKIGIATKGTKNPRLFVSLSAMKWERAGVR